MKLQKQKLQSETTINRLFKNRYFLLSLQIIMLFVFALIVYSASDVRTKNLDFAKILGSTNFPSLLVWSYWWPLIVVVAILFGRFWCSICPMELVTSFVGRFGLKRKPGKFIKSGWLSTIFFILIVVVGFNTRAINNIPHLMAVYMIILFSVTVIAGLIWEKRTLCTYLCPIGHLLGLYSLFSFKELRVVDPNVCKNCKEKSCISKENHYNYVGRSCTSGLYPAKISDNRVCLVCGQCHKSCAHDNIVIKKRKFAADLFKRIQLTWAEISFFIFVTGYILYEILREQPVTEKIVMALPNWVNQSLNISGRVTGSIKSLILFGVLPFLFYLIFVLIKKIVAKEKWKESFSQLTIAILPITAGMYLLKALLQTTSGIPYWHYAIADPEGVKAAHLLMGNPDLLNNSILFVILPVINIAGIFLLIGSLILSVMVIRKQEYKNSSSGTISIIAVLIYSSIFLSALIAWQIF